jgi:hypothetical protein
VRTPEGVVKKGVDTLLVKLHCWVDTRTSRGFGRRGIPDRTGCYRGFFFGIEIKELDTMKPDKWQEREMRKIVEAGGFAICVGAPSHLERLTAFFAEIDAIAEKLDLVAPRNFLGTTSIQESA